MLCPGKEFAIEDLKHRAARARSNNDNFRVLEPAQDGEGHGSGFRPITRVESRLTAAGQLLWTFKRVTEPLENVHHTDAHLREHQVHKTRNEQGYDHPLTVGRSCAP